MKAILSGLMLAVAALLAPTAAQSAVVTCGDATLGVRVTVVDPGLPGGYCYAQLGNLQDADIANLGLSLIEKDSTALGLLGGDLRGSGHNANSGTWSFGADLWDDWSRLFIGFHFGNAGDFESTNPDSFIVELARPDIMGTWELAGTGARLNGLSNLYLLGVNDGSPPPNEIPEPTTLALVGLGLLGAGAARRRRQA